MDLFALQTKSGALWPEIAEALIEAGKAPDSDRDAAIVKDFGEQLVTIQKQADNRYAYILKSEEALAAGASIEEVRAILDPLIVVEKTPEQDKANAEIDRIEQDLRDELAKRIAELELKRAEINK